MVELSLEELKVTSVAMRVENMKGTGHTWLVQMSGLFSCIC